MSIEALAQAPAIAASRTPSPSQRRPASRVYSRRLPKTARFCRGSAIRRQPTLRTEIPATVHGRVRLVAVTLVSGRSIRRTLSGRSSMVRRIQYDPLLPFNALNWSSGNSLSQGHAVRLHLGCLVRLSPRAELRALVVSQCVAQVQGTGGSAMHALPSAGRRSQSFTRTEAGTGLTGAPTLWSRPANSWKHCRCRVPRARPAGTRACVLHAARHWRW